MPKADARANPESLFQLVGDPTEMAVLHDRLYPRLFRYAIFRINDQAVAEDLTSEAFVRLLEAVRKKRQQIENLDAWLMGTLSNLVNDHLRRRYRQPTAELNENIVSRLPNPHAVLEQSERQELVARAMQVLTENQQQVLSLRFGAEMSLAETAEIMGRQENAVKALQFRALNALKRHLSEKAYE